MPHDLAGPGGGRFVEFDPMIGAPNAPPRATTTGSGSMDPTGMNPPRTPHGIVTGDELLRLEIPPREMVLSPILPVKGLAMLYGPRGLGKTMVALGVAYATASGGPFLRWQAPVARRVLYIDGEMPAVTTQERLRTLVQGGGPIPPEASLRFLLADLRDYPMPDLGTPSGQAALEQIWGDQPDLLVLDNLSCLTNAARDNEADSWSPLQSWLLSLRRRGVSVLIVHHAGKGGQQRGTSRREDVLDTVISLRRPSDYSPKDGARFEVHLEKARGVVGDDAEPFEARLQANERGEPVWMWEELKDSVLKRAALLFTEGDSVSDVAGVLGVSRSVAGRLRKRAVAEGLLAP